MQHPYPRPPVPRLSLSLFLTTHTPTKKTKTQQQVTQLGHDADLADAFVACLGNPKAARQIFNISGDRFVSFDGLARACAAAGGFPEPELVHFEPKDFDFGKKKAFPMRSQVGRERAAVVGGGVVEALSRFLSLSHLQTRGRRYTTQQQPTHNNQTKPHQTNQKTQKHFFTSIDKAQEALGWSPKFGLLDGLKDSYAKDFGAGTFRKAADFECDDMVLEKVKGKTFVAA